MTGGFLGELFATLSFVGALIATPALLFAGTRKGLEVSGWRKIGYASFTIHAISVAGIIGTMFYLIASHQFQYHYVWSHSSNELPVYYMISCFWEGQEGSFLLWTFWHAVLGSILLLFSNKAWRDIVVGVIASVNLVLASMILGIYVPGLGTLVLTLLAIIGPAGYLIYRFLQKKDDLLSKGLVHITGGAIAVISITLLLTENSGVFAFSELGSMFSVAGLPYLLAFLLILGFAILVIAQIVKAVSTREKKVLDTSEIFSAIALIFVGIVALTTEIGTAKVGSTPFLLLRDAFPDAPIFQSNPDFTPVNGNGLNPLLQNYWMVIHPPTLFLGFASTVVPFAFVMGGLMTGRYVEWIRPSIPWLIFSVMILGIGIIMGGYWAYETLNFGGYWNWDPVENSSFVPWIAGIASLHALVAYRKSKAFLKLTMALVSITFLLVLYSTFLTRSGILGETSVHTFTDLGLSGQLILLMAIYFIWMVSIFVSRWNLIPVGTRVIRYRSAEFVLFLAVAVLSAVGIIITIATSIPVFNNILGTNFAPVKDASFFYFRWVIWFTIALAILSGLGQFMYWRRVGNKKLSSALLRPYLLALGLAAGMIACIIFFTNWDFIYEPRYREWAELAELSENGFVKAFRYIRLAFFIFTDEILFFSALFMIFANLDVMINLLSKKRKTRLVTGGSIAHIGFALMLIGFLFSSGYDQVISKNVNPQELAALPQDARIDNVLLEKNRPRDILGYQVTYIGKKEAQPPLEDIEVLWQTEDEFKVSFLDATDDKYAIQLPKLVFLDKAGEIDMVFVKEFLDDKIDFLRPKHINDRTLYGVKFTPRVNNNDGTVAYQENKSFVLYPEAEVNPEMGLIAHPSRKIKATSDIYVHVSTIPKAEEEEAKFEFYRFSAQIGDTMQTARAGVYFAGITPQETAGTPFSLIVQVDLQVVTDNGTRLVANPLYRIDQQNQISIKDFYIEEIATSVAMVSIDPETGTFGFQFQERTNAPEDIIVIQALKKPYINVLWLGTFILVAGFIVAMVRRIKENSRLGGKSVAAEDEYPETQEMAD